MTGFDGSSVLVMVDGFEYSVSADKVHAMTQADPEPKRYGAGKGFTTEQAREAMRKVGAELQANAGHLAGVLDAAEAPQPEHTSEYYVMPHGFTAPANRPAARFPYVGVEAGDAFDQALTWAREYVKTSFDVWHSDAERSTFIRAGDGRRAAGLAPSLTRPGPGRGLDPLARERRRTPDLETTRDERAASSPYDGPLEHREPRRGPA